MSAHEQLKEEIARHCVEIEDITSEFSVPMSKVTVIARDPTSDGMFVIVTNEDRPGLEKAFQLALGDSLLEMNQLLEANKAKQQF